MSFQVTRRSTIVGEKSFYIDSDLSTTQTIVANWSQKPAEGSLLVVHVDISLNGSTAVPIIISNSGWLSGNLLNTYNVNNKYKRMYYRVAGRDEPPQVSWQISSTDPQLEIEQAFIRGTEYSGGVNWRFEFCEGHTSAVLTAPAGSIDFESFNPGNIGPGFKKNLLITHSVQLRTPAAPPAGFVTLSGVSSPIEVVYSNAGQEPTDSFWNIAMDRITNDFDTVTLSPQVLSYSNSDLINGQLYSNLYSVFTFDYNELNGCSSTINNTTATVQASFSGIPSEGSLLVAGIHVSMASTGSVVSITSNDGWQQTHFTSITNSSGNLYLFHKEATPKENYNPTWTISANALIDSVIIHGFEVGGGRNWQLEVVNETNSFPLSSGSNTFELDIPVAGIKARAFLTVIGYESNTVGLSGVTVQEYFDEPTGPTTTFTGSEISHGLSGSCGNASIGIIRKIFDTAGFFTGGASYSLASLATVNADAGIIGVSFSYDLINYKNDVLLDQPLVYWRLNETTGNAINLGTLGSIADGIYTGVPPGNRNNDSLLASDQANGSVCLTNTVTPEVNTMYISTNGPAIPSLALSGYTVEFLSLANDIGTLEYLLHVGLLPGDYHILLQASGDGGGPTNEIISANAGSTVHTAPGILKEAQVHHIAMTYDPIGNLNDHTLKRLSIYVDGELVANGPWQESNNIFGHSLSHPGELFPLALGRIIGHNQEFARRCLDEFALYGDTLSAGRIKSHYFNTIGLGNLSPRPIPVPGTIEGISVESSSSGSGTPNIDTSLLPVGPVIGGPPAIQPPPPGVFPPITPPIPPQPGDTVPPVITITSPTTGSSFNTSNNPITISGTSSDNIGVMLIAWKNNTTGGAGVASGLTSWSANIPIIDGANSITVTAFDQAGNSSTDSITINLSTLSLDNIDPVITITVPTSSPTISVSTTPINIAGSASDNVGVISVTWSNAQTGFSGTANGTTSWSSSVGLVSGVNNITVTSIDAAGNSSSDQIAITYSVISNDFTDPNISISPSIPTTTNSSTITVSGTSSDNSAIASITWTNTTTGGTGVASGTTSWSSDIPLASGLNNIIFTAIDTSGNDSNVMGFTTFSSLSGDTTTPTVSITGPTSAATYGTTFSSINLSGSSSDNVAVSSVTWQNTTNGTSGTASGTNPWFALVPLADGSNTIIVTAIDSSGNVSNDTITVTRNSVPSILTTSVNTSWSSAPITGRLLVAYVSTKATGGTIFNIPAGWVEDIRVYHDNDNTTGFSSILHKIAQPNEPLTFSWSISGVNPLGITATIKEYDLFNASVSSIGGTFGSSTSLSSGTASTGTIYGVACAIISDSDAVSPFSSPTNSFTTITETPVLISSLRSVSADRAINNESGSYSTTVNEVGSISDWSGAVVIYNGFPTQSILFDSPLSPPPLIPPAIQRTGGNNPNGGPITTTFGSVPTNGNLLVAYVSADGTNINFTAPVGWVEDIRRYHNNDTNSGFSSILHRIAGASEPQSTIWSYSATTMSGLIVDVVELSIQGAVATPISANHGNTTNIGSGSITIGSSIGVICGNLSDSDGSRLFTNPTGGFTRLNESLVNTSFLRQLSTYRPISNSSGTFSTSTTEQGSSPWSGNIVMFNGNPPSAPNTPPSNVVITSPVNGQQIGVNSALRVRWNQVSDSQQPSSSIRYNVQTSTDGGTTFTDAPGLIFDPVAQMGLTTPGLTSHAIGNSNNLPPGNMIIRVIAFDGITFSNSYTSINITVANQPIDLTLIPEPPRLFFVGSQQFISDIRVIENHGYKMNVVLNDSAWPSWVTAQSILNNGTNNVTVRLIGVAPLNTLDIFDRMYNVNIVSEVPVNIPPTAPSITPVDGSNLSFSGPSSIVTQWSSNDSDGDSLYYNAWVMSNEIPVFEDFLTAVGLPFTDIIIPGLGLTSNTSTGIFWEEFLVGNVPGTITIRVRAFDGVFFSQYTTVTWNLS